MNVEENSNTNETFIENTDNNILHHILSFILSCQTNYHHRFVAAGSISQGTNLKNGQNYFLSVKVCVHMYKKKCIMLFHYWYPIELYNFHSVQPVTHE